MYVCIYDCPYALVVPSLHLPSDFQRGRGAPCTRVSTRWHCAVPVILWSPQYL